MSAPEVTYEPCWYCDGEPCDSGCRRRCRHAYDGPDSHRVCRRCGGTGQVEVES